MYNNSLFLCTFFKLFFNLGARFLLFNPNPVVFLFFEKKLVSEGVSLLFSFLFFKLIPTNVPAKCALLNNLFAFQTYLRENNRHHPFVQYNHQMNILDNG